MSEKSKGFTLIELVVVVAIIALIFMFALPTLSSNFKIGLNSAARQLSSVVVQAYNASVLTGKVYRVAFDLKENQYWVEEGAADVVLDTKESLDKANMRKKFSDPNAPKPPSAFKIDKSITRKEIALPRGVTFEDVLTQVSDEPLKKGIAYAHFFPHGFAEQSIIHIQDTANHHASLVITSVVGQLDVYNRYVGKKEAFERDER